ncbi:MerR family transcriptional regulator [Halocynthiibacter sp. SDUM655004]|uniref:MerR family transcriptional regulator n=1 Tax=Halocynthiibacter halioticoli TaxID=2986804 RepID=A0AAE3LQ95_9RHOB|nr:MULTISPECIES: MerR family transcriptional regulator [Halocynthiibacter]MCV6824232.1 MerR family transcriptional regulator [Halocynthiibacter halioticoli]MCW4057233.1 MerR family transcriptional regulator [Halocynthiibacter sp. SDUM655004]
MAKSRDAFRTISEVADWLDTPAHVLRFWESRFTQVKPVKRAGGRRYYRPADMELLGGIKRLLHDDGMTIKGVQKLLREEGIKHVAGLSQPIDDDGDAEKPSEKSEASAHEDAQPVEKREENAPDASEALDTTEAEQEAAQASEPEEEETEVDAGEVVSFPPPSDLSPHHPAPSANTDQADDPAIEPDALPFLKDTAQAAEEPEVADTAPSVQDTIQSIVDDTLEDIVAEEISAFAESDTAEEASDAPTEVPAPTDPHQGFSLSDLDLPAPEDVPEEPAFFTRSEVNDPSENVVEPAEEAPETAEDEPLTLEEKIKSAVDRVSGDATPQAADSEEIVQASLDFSAMSVRSEEETVEESSETEQEHAASFPSFSHAEPQGESATEETPEEPAATFVMPEIADDPEDDASGFDRTGIRAALAANKAERSPEETAQFQEILTRLRALQNASGGVSNPSAGN